MEDKGILWDFIKCKIKGMTFGYSANKAANKRKYELDLEEKISGYEKKDLK